MLKYTPVAVQLSTSQPPPVLFLGFYDADTTLSCLPRHPRSPLPVSEGESVGGNPREDL
ncbi:hypothetical protein M430DRAFT_14862 [Amorphotheca resinae ATCC 22711]|uniref:Uncharacterized protein n=1 Tax=Amorphotheca resinae ATCC 22711 TaxID=857342 RepID=A0A2T3BDX9_AMORE|nr:hypothetical protein M430DRAFT_14862 [Amorphotheca resinae ATCC 22711]PSS27595.1 hypothetical protein M430DRAFT_14862 [Amorphotheca resinae ATCC 22711]